MVQASVDEFTANKSKLPATRDAIVAVGPYILELYSGGILDMGGEGYAIEINKKQADGSYNSEESLKFTEESEATSTYKRLKDSQSEIESIL